MSDSNILNSLNNNTVNAIRDLATSIQNKDLLTAIDLLKIAHEARPKGSYIKKKLLECENILANNKKKVQSLIDEQELLIVPVGFRCYTKMNIKSNLGIQLESYPFDSGFFPPSSVISLLSNPEVNLSMEDSESHTVCRKIEYFQHPRHGRGIVFETSNYSEINVTVENVDKKKLNQFLDSTYGYYTLDKTHQYVLAHYNWHEKADPKKSKGVTDPKQNLKVINEMMNRRIERLLQNCKKYKNVVFVYEETQKYKHMTIDSTVHDLVDFAKMEPFLKTICGHNSYVCKVSEIDNPMKLLKMIGYKTS